MDGECRINRESIKETPCLHWAGQAEQTFEEIIDVDVSCSDELDLFLDDDPELEVGIGLEQYTEEEWPYAQ